jgi:glycosyltransferase involved in cell wall biosynthesis
MVSEIGMVIIGRNEGERLRASLGSALGKTAATIYVDSGSTDASAALAAEMGAVVVKLDDKSPSTAARARNAGLATLIETQPAISFVQFIDGDCEVAPDWLERAFAAIEGDGKLAAVAGRRRERNPGHSIYNRLMDLEWDTPVGSARSVGGDALFRVAAFQGVGGFDAALIAGEEPELCLRVRQAGWKILRIDAEMTRHDADLLHFSQWWRRQVRSGWGAMDVESRLPRNGEHLFAKMLGSSRIWTIIWLLATAAAGAIGTLVAGRCAGIAAAIVIALSLPVQGLRIAWQARRRGWATPIAIWHGAMTMLGKWAMLWGQMRWLVDRAAGRRGRLIEYKQSAAAKGTP